MNQPAIVDGVLYGMPEVVASWVSERIPGCTGFGPCEALGLVRDGMIVGGMVFSSWRPGSRDIEMSGAMAPGFQLSTGALRRALHYAFGDLGAVRITIETGRKNRAARAFALRLGAKLEGVRRRGLDGRQDKILYGLLASECRILRRDC